MCGLVEREQAGVRRRPPMNNTEWEIGQMRAQAVEQLQSRP